MSENNVYPKAAAGEQSANVAPNPSFPKLEESVLDYWEKDDTFQFKLLEALNPDVLKTVYGDDNVTGTVQAGLTVKANSSAAEDKAWVVELILNGVLKRVVVPKAKITEMDDIVYADEEALGYDITITATPDTDGNTHYEYIKEKTA